MQFKACLLVIITLNPFATSTNVSLPIPLSPDYHVEPIERPQFETLSLQTTNHPTQQNEYRFIDDFACDTDNGIIGWSNCDHIHTKYHGPFNSFAPNTIYRHFECDASSTAALISFSIVFDCNVAFTDTVLLSINNNIISQYNSATQEDILNDTALLSISACNWYVDRNITHTIPLMEDHSFQLKFETLFKVNIDKNIAIFDIGIDCIQATDDDATKSNVTIVRDDVLKCHRSYTNSNCKSNIDTLLTMNDNFIAFAVQHTDPRIITELALSHFDGYDLKKNTYSDAWYWNIQLELSKKQIVVQNKSQDTVTRTIFPLRFKIKDEDDCYLDINDKESTVFWNCEDGKLWSYDDATERLYVAYNATYFIYLQWDHIRNESKATFVFDDSNRFYMISANEFRYNSYRIIASHPYKSDICQLSKDTQQSIFTQTDGSIVVGYRAIFKCDTNGINIKMEIPQLAGIATNDWANFWITSFTNNIKIGIGDLIGNEEDVLFAFTYADDVRTSNLQCVWISTLPLYYNTNWRFYDYYNSSVCNIEFMEQHNITQDLFNYVDDYSLYGSKAKYLPNYLWHHPYLMFEVSSSTETWIKFKIKTKVIVIHYGKQDVKGICDSKAEEETYSIVISIDDEYICSEYNDYRLSEPWLFWMQWYDDNVLEIGNGAIIGQSVITHYDHFNGGDIESISFGCSEYEVCEWGFYTHQQQLVLQNKMFSPQSKLLFAYYYDDSIAMFYNHTSIEIYSYSLHLDYILFISFHTEYIFCVLCDRHDDNECVECRLDEIIIHLPDYNHIAMHRTFDTEYEILLTSSALLLKDSKYLIQRNHFMNVSIEFVNDIMIDQTLKVSKVNIHNAIITQNASYIHLKSPMIGIDAVLCINYAINECLICYKNDITHNKQCVSCYDGIQLGTSYVEKRIHNLSFPKPYTLSIASSDTLLSKYKHKISITNCAIGSGLILHDTYYKCNECGANTLNLLANDNYCHLCPIDAGYFCQGSNVWIDYNHWLTISDQHSNQISFEITSSICPFSYCCQNKNGCSYNDSTQLLCALNRDPNIALCGGCLPGYAEIFGDSYCMLCTEDNYTYLAVLLAFALLYVIAISCVFQRDTEQEEFKKQSYESITHQMQNFKCSTLILKDYIDALCISLFHCIAYFYQAIAYILVHYNYGTTERMNFILPLLQIFSMDLNIKNSAFCFLRELDALYKQIWLLFIPCSLFIAVFVLWILLRCISRIFRCSLTRYVPDFKALLWCLALLSFSTIINHLFNILSCRQIGAVTIHFIAPQYECYDEIWWMALIAILCIITCWSLIFIMIFIMDPARRQQSSSSQLHQESITNPYTSACWYYEFVILSRRLWISALVTFHYLNETRFNILLAILFMFCLGLHLKFKPFKYNRINNMETACLFLLLCCFSVINLTENEVVIAVVVISALLFPFLLFVSGIYSTIKLHVSVKSEDSKLNEHQQRILFTAIDRLPTSRRDIILAIIQKTMPYINIPLQAAAHDDIESAAAPLHEDGTITKNTYIVTDISTDHEEREHEEVTVMVKTNGVNTITEFTKTVPVVTSLDDRTGILSESTDADQITGDMLSTSNSNNYNTINTLLFTRNHHQHKGFQSDFEMTEDGELEQNENEQLLSTMAIGSRTETLTLDCKIKNEPKFSFSQSPKWIDFEIDDTNTDTRYLFQSEPIPSSY